MTLSRILGCWCHCTEKLLPLGADAIWQDGRKHTAAACWDTDDVDSTGPEGEA